MRPDINYGTTDTNHDDITSRSGYDSYPRPPAAIGRGYYN